MAKDASPTIVCPSCKTEVRLTESLAAPLIAEARREMEREVRRREEALSEREVSLHEQAEALGQLRLKIDDEVAERVKSERAAIAAAEAKRARDEIADEITRAQQLLADRDEQLRIRDQKIAQANQRELELLKQRRALEAQAEELELTIERRLADERSKLVDEARKRADEDSRLKMAEKDKLINDMQRQVEELRRKAEQGSQQLQGEVQELELEGVLRATFPRDSIEPVPKGEYGGDVLERVHGAAGQLCGSILWESKRTKNWSNGWLPKLRDDQRAAKADAAILISQVLPEGIEGFGQVDGVWIASPKNAVPLALCVRQLVIEVALARQAGEGREQKIELVYRYLTGPQFRQRVEAMVESFRTMQDDLSRERTAMIKQWSKREQLIQRALGAAAGMYGDLQGIAGATLTEIDGLDLRLLPEGGEAE